MNNLDKFMEGMFATIIGTGIIVLIAAWIVYSINNPFWLAMPFVAWFGYLLGNHILKESKNKKS